MKPKKLTLPTMAKRKTAKERCIALLAVFLLAALQPALIAAKPTNAKKIKPPTSKRIRISDPIHGNPGYGPMSAANGFDLKL